MNSKELRDAAEKLDFWFHMESDNYTDKVADGREPDPEYRETILAARHCAKHILATVHADDNEPVDRRFLESVSHSYEEFPFSNEPVHQVYFRWTIADGIYVEKRHVFYVITIGGKEVLLKSRSQLRSLCRGLGIEVPE